MKERKGENGGRGENSLRKTSQALGSSEDALRLGVSFPLSLTLYL